MVKRTPNLDDTNIISTMQIDPDQYSPRIARNRFEGIKYALAGLLYLLRRQQSIQALLVVSVISTLLALWLQVPLTRFLLMVFAIGVVWVTEALNTAIEAVVNIAAPELHPMAKVSKDVAAAAALIASTLAALVTLLTVIPSLLERI